MYPGPDAVVVTAAEHTAAARRAAERAGSPQGVALPQCGVHEHHATGHGRRRHRPALVVIDSPRSRCARSSRSCHCQHRKTNVLPAPTAISAATS